MFRNLVGHHKMQMGSNNTRNKSDLFSLMA